MADPGGDGLRHATVEVHACEEGWRYFYDKGLYSTREWLESVQSSEGKWTVLEQDFPLIRLL